MPSKVIVFAFFMGFASVALADESSADSAKVFRQVCDKAMPDLLKGDFDSASTTLSSISSPSLNAIYQAFLADTKRKFQAANTSHHPIDWKYIGVKRLGDKLCQLTYVCRYSEQPIMWTFVAQKQDGRWALNGMYVDDNAAKIVKSCGLDTETTDESCRQLCGEFADLLAHGKFEAVDYFQKNLLTTADADRAKSMVSAALIDNSEFGRLLGCELVHVRDCNGTLRSFTYLIQSDRNIVTIDVYIYRPDKDWKFLGFAGEANLQRVFSDVAVESRTQRTEYQAAQAQSSKAATRHR